MIFDSIKTKILQAVRNMVGYKDIEQVYNLRDPISDEMRTAIDLWSQMYQDKAPWLADVNVTSLNIPAFVCSELARLVTIEMEVDIDAGNEARTELLNTTFGQLQHDLRTQLEQGMAIGGMVIKPYLRNNQIYFDYVLQGEFIPLSFDEQHRITDIIFPEALRRDKYFYTRLERHTISEAGVTVTNKAYRSTQESMLGSEIPLTDVQEWAQLAPEALVTTNKPLFGYYRVAQANTVEGKSPLGVSVFSRAVKNIEQADLQWSRLLWEFEGGELSVDIDVNAMKFRKNPNGRNEEVLTPKMYRLRERLFRKIDLGQDSTYQVFNPNLRDISYINGLNSILKRIEDQCGLARGTLSDAETEARTATEIKTLKQRTYANISDNQNSLEMCLNDAIEAANVYISTYSLAPESGELQVNYEWDDSIITDTATQFQERILLKENGAEDAVGLRMWYFGETEETAIEAVDKIRGREPTVSQMF
jgi:A118 family predicted phage portal protein